MMDSACPLTWNTGSKADRDANRRVDGHARGFDREDVLCPSGVPTLTATPLSITPGFRSHTRRDHRRPMARSSQGDRGSGRTGRSAAICTRLPPRWTCPVLGLTGSNGKTTTKELIRDVLATQWDVHATAGNFNNHIGVPLTLLNAPKNPEFVVVEMGANHQKEIALLATLPNPPTATSPTLVWPTWRDLEARRASTVAKKNCSITSPPMAARRLFNDRIPKVVRGVADVQKRVDVHLRSGRWHAEQRRNTKHIQHPDGQTFPMQLGRELQPCPTSWPLSSIGDHFGVPWNRAQRALSPTFPQPPISSRGYRRTTGCCSMPTMPIPQHDVCRERFFVTASRRGLAILGDMAELGNASAARTNASLHLAREQGWSCGRWARGLAERRPSDTASFLAAFSTPCDALVDTSQRTSPFRPPNPVKGSRSAGLEDSFRTSVAHLSLRPCR